LMPPSSGQISSSLMMEHFGHPTAYVGVVAKGGILPLPRMKPGSSNYLIRCDAIQSGRCLQICCRNTLPSSSTMKENRTGGSRGNVLDLYSGGVRFEFRNRHQLRWLRFLMVHASSSRQIPG
jgi:hypothetical protein